MKNSDLLKQQRAALEGKIEPLASKVDRTTDEANELRAHYTQLEKLNADIELEEKNEQFAANRAAAQGRTISANDSKDIQKYSFSRVIKLLSEGKNPDNIDGIEGEMYREGLKERAGMETKGFVIPTLVLEHSGVKRSSTGQNVATSADGGYLVQESPLVFIESLKNAMVLYQLGATLLPGLTGNLPLVKGGSFTASWIAEGSAVTTTKQSFSKATMTPKNLMVAGALSKQLMVQAPSVAERFTREELVKAMALGLQAAAINGSGSGATPTGILNYTGIGSVPGGDNGLAAAWSHIVNLESEVANDNAVFQSNAYLTNTKVRGKLKQTLKSSGVAGYIWEGNEINGYPAFVTNAVPSTLNKGTSTGVCSAIIFGSFSELFMGMWGGLDIVVDPYSLKKQNEIEIVFNQFADVALRNAEAFAAMKDVLTT